MLWNRFMNAHHIIIWVVTSCLFVKNSGKFHFLNSLIDVHVMFSPDLDNYTHEIIRAGDL